jgi:hypothetical protein
MALLQLDVSKGLTNRYGNSEIPKNYARDAKDILIGNTGQLRFPRWGKLQVYAGNCHSIVETSIGTFFVEDGTLKKLNLDYSATTVKTGVGNSRMYYAGPLSTTLFFGNDSVTGTYVSGVGASEWGCARTPRQPDSEAITIGDLYAGDYRYAVTWIGSHDEGGTGNSATVTVPEGGSIVLSNFPAAPAYVTAFAVYVTPANGKDLYLYGEYPIATTTVTITRLTSDGVVPTIPLETQLAFPPTPKETMVSHQGRIYYAVDNQVYWTLPFRYGQQVTGSYWNFDSDVQYIASTPGALYVATLNGHYKITNIDAEDPVQVETQLDTGGVKGSVCYDRNGVYFYSMTGRGVIRGTPEKLEELTYEALAMPSYSSGYMATVEMDGLKQLLFVGAEAVRNPMEHADFTQLTPTVPTAWLINMDTGAITRATFSANSLDSTFAADASGVYLIGGHTDNDTAIYGSLRTGLSDFAQEAEQDRTYDPNALKHLSDAYIVMKGNKMAMTTTCDDGALIYSTIATTNMEQVKLDGLARGTKSYLWGIGLDNVSGGATLVNAIKIEIQSLRRRSGRNR